MSEQKTYDQRVREIAEEMSKEWEARNIEHKDPEYLELLISEALPAARIAVKHMAVEFEIGYQKGYEFGFSTDETVNELKVAYGLIPTPERKEAGEV